MAMLDCQLLQQRWPQFQVVAYFPRDEHAGEIWARVTKDDAGTEELIRDLDEEALHRLDTEHADRAQQVRLNERFTFLYIGRPGPDRRATIWLCRDGRPAETTGVAFDFDGPPEEIIALLGELNIRAGVAVVDADETFWCAGCYRALPKQYLHGYYQADTYCTPCVDEDPALRERVAPGAETLTYRQGARNGTHQI